MKAGLQRRVDDYVDNSPHDKQAGLWRHKPGSQNIKKGYGTGLRKR